MKQGQFLRDITPAGSSEDQVFVEFEDSQFPVTAIELRPGAVVIRLDEPEAIVGSIGISDAVREKQQAGTMGLADQTRADQERVPGDAPGHADVRAFDGPTPGLQTTESPGLSGVPVQDDQVSEDSGT